MLNVYLFFTALVLCCSYALIRGAAPERIGAGIFIAATILTRLAASAERPSFASAEVGVFLVDAGMLSAFLLLAMLSKRFWPLWMTGFQVVQVAVHAAQIASPQMMPWVYAVGQAIWSYPMMAMLALGTWRHQERLRLHGADAAWRSFSNM